MPGREISTALHDLVGNVLPVSLADEERPCTIALGVRFGESESGMVAIRPLRQRTQRVSAQLGWLGRAGQQHGNARGVFDLIQHAADEFIKARARRMRSSGMGVEMFLKFDRIWNAVCRVSSIFSGGYREALRSLAV